MSAPSRPCRTAGCTGIEHKPSRPSSGTVATEIFVYDSEALVAAPHDLRRELAGKVDVFDHPDRPVISHWPDRPAARVRATGECRESLLSPGADVSGLVVGSVLGPGVVVEKGAEVRDSILMEDRPRRAQRGRCAGTRG